MLSEAEIYQLLIKKFGAMEGANTVGIGDDCAVIPLDSKRNMLVSKDLLVGEVHFKNSWGRFKELGFKSVAVNVSDISAMGGKPLHVLLGVSIPSQMRSEQFEEFLNGIQEALRTYKIKLIGGDTTGSRSDFFISVTILGEVFTSFLKLRSTAKVGDMIVVTSSRIGDAAAGLDCLMAKGPLPFQSLIEAQLKPMVQAEHGQWMGEQTSVHAMMDLSDGIFQDLQRLCQSSGCGAEVHMQKIPRSKDFESFMMQNKNGKSETDYLLGGGEDYCLLATVSERDFLDVESRFKEKFGSSLYPIGRITDSSQTVQVFKDGKAVEPPRNTFSHF